LLGITLRVGFTRLRKGKRKLLRLKSHNTGYTENSRKFPQILIKLGPGLRIYRNVIRNQVSDY